MVVQIHALDKELPTWTGDVEASVSLNTLNNLCKQKVGYIQIEQKHASLIHDILAIALFKSASEDRKNFLPVLQYCNKNVLLELVRPAGCNHEFYTSLVKINDEFRECGKVFVYRLTSYWSKDWEHPLQPIALFREKSQKYLVAKQNQ